MKKITSIIGQHKIWIPEQNLAIYENLQLFNSSLSYSLIKESLLDISFVKYSNAKARFFFFKVES